jgi:hypothetical protein
MMKSYTKKILSFALVVIMLVSVFASSALTGHAAELEPSADSGYTIYREKNYLFGVKGSTSVSNFKKMFSGQNITVTNPSRSNLMSSAYIPTGSIIKLMSGTTVLDQLTVIVGGDVDCDGKVNATDLAVVKAKFKNSVTLSDAAFNAADADGNVDALTDSGLSCGLALAESHHENGQQQNDQPDQKCEYDRPRCMHRYTMPMH